MKSYKNRLRREQDPPPAAGKKSVHGDHLKKLRDKVRRRTPVVTPVRITPPEEHLDVIDRGIRLYLTHTRAADVNPDYQVGIPQIGLLVGYARGSEALVKTWLGRQAPDQRYVWREIQHRVRQLLIRQTMKRLADCL